MLLEHVIGNPYTFLECVRIEMESVGLDLSEFDADGPDHICYRVETIERYREVCAALFKLGKVLTETKVGGRLIATFRLWVPISYRGWVVRCIEVPAPKPGSPYPEGLEHAEFVLQSGTLEEFMDRYPELTFKTAALERESNPEVGLTFRATTVKFHLLSLAEVIAHEQAAGQ